MSDQQKRIENIQPSQLLGQYLSLEEFCTCTQTYQKYADRIDPSPENLEETLPALEALCQHILDPVITHFGRKQFQLAYGFCSKDLKRFLAQKDPETGIKNGRVDPSRDQHMAHEKNRNGRYYCDRLGAACDFRIMGLESDRLIEWILEQQLRFDSLYYYGGHDRFTSVMAPNTKVLYGHLQPKVLQLRRFLGTNLPKSRFNQDVPFG